MQMRKTQFYLEAFIARFEPIWKTTLELMEKIAFFNISY